MLLITVLLFAQWGPPSAPNDPNMWEKYVPPPSIVRSEKAAQAMSGNNRHAVSGFSGNPGSDQHIEIPTLVSQPRLQEEPKLRDVGFGVCPAFSHFHDTWMMLSEDERYVWETKYPVITLVTERPVMDGMCHSDLTDEPLPGNNNELDNLQRRVLPVPR